MCTFLLKMREYYRWEQGLSLSQPLNKSAVGEWLNDRETQWQKYESKSLQDIPLHDNWIDPFDHYTLNQSLLPCNTVYSGGIGMFGKPQFFMAELLEHRQHKDYDIYISGEEYARDLVASPALSQDKSIFIRKQCLKRYLWEKLEEWQWHSDPNRPLARALNELGLNIEHDDNEQCLNQLCDLELESMLLHEVGEIESSQQLGAEWKILLDAVSHPILEMRLRAIKDHLADATTTLHSLIESQNWHSLHMYFANFTGIRKQLYPQLVEGYHQWSQHGELDALELFVAQGHNKWLNHCKNMIKLFHSTADRNALNETLNRYIEDKIIAGEQNG